MEYSERAVAAEPGGVDGTYWHGVAVGRRAMNASPGYAVELAQVSYEDAHAILAVDSLHGGAHNMLGKLNYEIMSLSRIKRGVARTFMSNPALDDTSWENAEYHLTRAVEVWPEFVLFHFDLAQFYRKRGRRDEAIAAFRRAIELPAVHPTDHSLQQQAREILTEWEALPDSSLVRVDPVDPAGLSPVDAPTDR
jgi:tetratricopeptide (TPR) repeat protein